MNYKKKEKQLAVAKLKVSVLKKKINILKREIKKMTT